MLNNLTNNPLQHVIPDNFYHTFQKTGLIFGVSWIFNKSNEKVQEG